MTIPFLQFLTSHFDEQGESPKVRPKGYEMPEGTDWPSILQHFTLQARHSSKIHHSGATNSPTTQLLPLSSSEAMPLRVADS